MKTHKGRAVRIVQLVVVVLMCGSLLCAGLTFILGAAAISSVLALHPIRASGEALFAVLNGVMAYMSISIARDVREFYLGIKSD